MHCMVTTN